MIRRARTGLVVAGSVQILIVLLMGSARLLFGSDPRVNWLRFEQSAITVAIGILTLLVSRVRALEPHYRKAAIVSGLLIAANLICFSMLLTNYDPSESRFIPGQMTLLMLVGVAAVPLRPLDTLFFGLTCEAMYLIAGWAIRYLVPTHAGVDPINLLFILLLTALSTGLTALVYEQRRSLWEAHQETIRAAERICSSESRTLLAQNAASVGRLAAALSHELNSPIGALSSAVDTLLLLAARQATSPPSEHERLVRLQADLRRSIKESTSRLKETVLRMQRFTNLDKAEVQLVNLNELLSDVAALTEPEARGKAVIALDLQPIPQLFCRPQQLSAVFSSLVVNALDAVAGKAGRIVVSTGAGAKGTIQVKITDNGRGMDAEQLASIFDPGFTVKRGRVAAGNWTLFSSRQIVREHGGEIHIDSTPGEGTTVVITFSTAEAEQLLAYPEGHA